MDKINFTELNSLNTIISNLYGSNLPTEKKIIDMFNHLVGLVHFDNAYIYFFYKDENNVYKQHSTISFSLDDNEIEDAKIYEEYASHFDDIYSIMDTPSSMIFKGSEFFNLEKRKAHKHWNEIYLPQNFFYSIDCNILIKSNTGYKCGMCFHRGVDRIDFNDKDIEIISLLQPHLANILNYYGEADDSTNMMFVFENITYLAIALLDENGDMVRCNQLYERHINLPELGSALSNKIKSMCLDMKRDDVGLSNPSSQYKFEDSPFFAEVSLLPSNNQNIPTQYCCLLFDLSCFFDFSLDKMREKYQLTTREFNILQAILHGKSNEDVANELYLSLPTVKKYLASIYSKMGIKNQKQILELLNIH